MQEHISYDQCRYKRHCYYFSSAESMTRDNTIKTVPQTQLIKQFLLKQSVSIQEYCTTNLHTILYTLCLQVFCNDRHAIATNDLYKTTKISPLQTLLINTFLTILVLGEIVARSTNFRIHVIATAVCCISSYSTTRWCTSRFVERTTLVIPAIIIYLYFQYLYKVYIKSFKEMKNIYCKRKNEHTTISLHS